MKYEIKSYDHLLGVPGFSDQLLKNHFALYQGYVKNTNMLYESLRASIQDEKAVDPEYAETKRRFGWEFNGMRLHEHYFGNMNKNGSRDKSRLLTEKLLENFGSVDNWEKSFKNVGKIRGIGWVLLSYDPIGDNLFNVWVNEHDGGNLSGSVPLLVMDVFEHAFMLDYGLKKEEYVSAFFKAIDWRTVSERLSAAASGKHVAAHT